MELTNGDVDLGKILAVLCRGQKHDQLVARLEVMQAELLPTSEEAGLTFEEIIEQRNEKKGFELILDLLTSKRHLTRRLLQSLEVAGMIERTDGEWGAESCLSHVALPWSTYSIPNTVRRQPNQNRRRRILSLQRR